MQNKFGKQLTTLIVGTLIIFPAQALAMKADGLDTTSAEALDESEIVIARHKDRGGDRDRGRKDKKMPLKENLAFAQSTSLAMTQLGNALAAAKAEAVGGSNSNALAQSIAKAFSLIGNATALSNSSAESDQAAAAQSLAEAETVLGDALAIAESEAISGDGEPAVAQSLATAKTAVGNATAIASSSAQSGQ